MIGVLTAAAICIVGAGVAEKKNESSIVIRKGNSIVTLVNVMVVQPARADSLLRLLEEGTESLFSKQPGFIAVSFHRNPEGNKIVLYGQWRSTADIDNFRKNPALADYFKHIRSLTESESSVVCNEVLYINAR